MESLQKISLRRMTKDDIDAVMEIEAAAYGEHHWSRESFYNEINNKLAYYYIALDSNSNIVGFAGSWQIIDEAHITTIAVSPTFRRNKTGEILLQAIFNECFKNKIKYITLEVRESNIPAISLYEKYGFKSLGVRKGYYQDNNENALIMWTENIFWDKFKEKYEQNTQELKDKVTIEWV